MEREVFERGMLFHFSIQPFLMMVDKNIWLMTSNYTTDVIAFDDLMVKRHGDFTGERGLSTFDIVKLEYGEAAVDFIKKSLK